MRRRRIAIAGAALLLVAGIVLALPLIVDVNRYRGRIEAVLRRQLHREATLGAMRLSVVPPGLTVENAVIGEDPAFQTGRPFARIQRLSVRPKLLPLLRGAFELRALELSAPEFEIVRGGNGQWNVATPRQEPRRRPRNRRSRWTGCRSPAARSRSPICRRYAGARASSAARHAALGLQEHRRS
jgi:uncharacterized protein involved in outer membrane biogenesis